MKKVEIVGVYIVKGSADVHLIEMIVYDHIDSKLIEEITQEIDTLPKENWQVAYDEYFLNPTGTEIIGDYFNNPKLISQYTRFTFFIYCLDFSKPLLTPFGKLELPKSQNIPSRLEELISFVEAD